MSKICLITGKKPMSGHNVSHSNRKTKRKFYPNLINKKFYLEEEGMWVQLRVSARGLRIINKIGLKNALLRAEQNGIIKL